MDLSTAHRIFWPQNSARFIAVGAFVSLAVDFASFLGSFGLPRWFIWLSLLAMILALILCWRNTLIAKKGNTQDNNPKNLDCFSCNTFRVLFFVSIGLTLLMIAGQGGSASERIISELGLIKEDVTVVRDSLSANELIDDPSSAQEMFHNAWVWAYVRRNDKESWKALQQLYSKYSPNKLDAAELYRSVGSAELGSREIDSKMIDIGRKRKDSAMLVVAARNTPKIEDAFALYAEAKGIDPEMPFAYWDVGRADLLAYGSINADSLYDNRYIKIEVDNLEKFIEVAERNPPSKYFYMPRYQGDFEGLARSRLEMSRQQIVSREKAERMRQESIARMKKLISRDN